MRTAYPQPDVIVPLTYSFSAAAKAWSIGRTTVYKLDREGKIRTIKIGPVKRIPADEVERIAREGVE